MFARYPEASANTLAIADRCSPGLDLSRRLFPSYSSHARRPGLQQRSDSATATPLPSSAPYDRRRRAGRITPAIQSRLDHELNIITPGFEDYSPCGISHAGPVAGHPLPGRIRGRFRRRILPPPDQCGLDSPSCSSKVLELERSQNQTSTSTSSQSGATTLPTTHTSTARSMSRQSALTPSRAGRPYATSAVCSDSRNPTLIAWPSPTPRPGGRVRSQPHPEMRDSGIPAWKYELLLTLAESVAAIPATSAPCRAGHLKQTHRVTPLQMAAKASPLPVRQRHH